MKTQTRGSSSQMFINEIQSARLRLVRAESQWGFACEQARIARRRRKEAKLAARRCRKQARRAKEELAEAREALLAAEERFAQAIERTAQIQKLARSRRAAKAVAARSRKKISHARRTSRRRTVRPQVRVLAATSTRRRAPIRPRRRSTPHLKLAAKPQPPTAKMLPVRIPKAPAADVSMVGKRKPFATSGRFPESGSPANEPPPAIKPPSKPPGLPPTN